MIKDNLLQQAVNNFADQKADKEELIPGLLGMTMNGGQRTTCINRPGYVWVRLHGNTSEFVQAYNDAVVPIYGMPVLVGRNPLDRSRYYIISDKSAHPGVLSANSTYLEYWDDDGVKHWTGNPSLGQTLTKATSTLQWVSRNHPVWSTGGWTHANWDGDAQAVGTTTFAVNDFNANISSGATAIYVLVQASWAAASSANFIYLGPGGTGIANVLTRGHVAGDTFDASGIIILNASHQFSIVIGGTDTTYTYIGVYGYWYTF